MVKSFRKTKFMIATAVFAFVAAVLLFVGAYPRIEGSAATVTPRVIAANDLLDEAASKEGGIMVPYTITGWTYGDEDVSVEVPRLAHGDEADDFIDNGAVTFELQRNGSVIATGFDRSEFADYINATMPSGDYRLRAEVAFDYEGGEHNDWWSGETHTEAATDEAFSRTYDFTVAKADMVFDLEAMDTEHGYDDYAWELNVADKSDFFSVFTTKVDEVGVKLVDVTPEGYWATDDAAQYYGSYTVKYNFDRMHSEAYYTAEDDYLRNLVEGGVNGSYVVYFQVSANNHNDLVNLRDAEDRRAHRFTVTVYETVPAPVVIDAGLVYTGEIMRPNIEENTYYKTVYDANDNYIDGGFHNIHFELYDPVHYRWEEPDEDDESTLTVRYKIASAQNTWVRVPNIVGWKYNTFDADTIRMPAVPRFGGPAVYTVTKDEEGKEPVEGLKSFTTDAEGTVTDKAVIAALSVLDAGKYYLGVFVEATINYDALLEYVPFTVSKASNAWSADDTFLLPAWVEGKYDEKENVISILPAQGADKVRIVITDLDGKEYYNSVSGLNNLGKAKAGKYLLSAWVEETDNYDALAVRTFTLEVLDKVGLPWWATLCIALGALLVAALIILILWKKGVFSILTKKIALALRTRATVEATIAAVRAAKVEEESKKTVAKAKRKDAARARAKARAEEMAKPADERAAALEAKAMAEAAKAEKIRERAEKLQEEAAKVRNENAEEAAEQADEEAAATAAEPAEETATATAEPAEEAAATATENPSDETTAE